MIRRVTIRSIFLIFFSTSCNFILLHNCDVMSNWIVLGFGRRLLRILPVESKSSNDNGMNFKSCFDILDCSSLFFVVYFHLRREDFSSFRGFFTFLLLSSSFFLSERFHPLRVLPRERLID